MSEIKSSNVVVNPAIEATQLGLAPEDKFDALNSKLLAIQSKTDGILRRMEECMFTSKVSSIDKKIEMIKSLWAVLSENNQKVLKKLMKNQFNICLSNFDIGPESKNMPPNAVSAKMSLKYVKPSIIESLYQEMDMLSLCLFLNDVCSQSPEVPLDENIH